MANPVKIQNSSPKSLKVMSDAEMDYIAHTILADFAGTSTGVGTLSVNPGDATGLTDIGTWENTAFDTAPGGALNTFTTSYQAFFGGFTPGAFTDTQNVFATTGYGTFMSNQDNLTQTDYAFYQNRGAVVETLTRPLEFDSSLKRLIAQIDANLNASAIAHTLDRLVNDGLGSYKLQTATPSGGTWVQEAIIDDTQSGAGSTEYYLWRRTVQTTPTEIRPLKERLIGNEYNIIEMTDAEIETLTDRFRNQIVTTGIGTYALQETAPGTGTWTRAGTVTTDTRRDTFTDTFIPAYAGASYSASYSQGFQDFFGGFAGAFFTGFFAGTAYAGSYAAAGQSYQGTYVATATETITTKSLWVRTA